MASLVIVSYSLCVVFVDFCSCVVVEMMHLGTQQTLHGFRACACFVLRGLEAHVTSIMLVALIILIFCSISSNSAKSCRMSICFTENAIFRDGHTSCWSIGGSFLLASFVPIVWKLLTSSTVLLLKAVRFLVSRVVLSIWLLAIIHFRM